MTFAEFAALDPGVIRYTGCAACRQDPCRCKPEAIYDRARQLAAGYRKEIDEAHRVAREGERSGKARALYRQAIERWEPFEPTD